MPRSDEAEWWFTAVYEAIQQIPHGKITTYGHIALLLKEPQRARQVGVCLKQLPREEDAAGQHFHDGNVPWQRVINAKGQISPRGPDGAARQAARLEQEDVHTSTNAMGEISVSLSEYGWFPERLPNDL